MKAAERAERDADVLRMFMAGSTYAQIARVTAITQTRVDQIVKRELAAAARRRTLLTDKALEIHTERSERLFLAYWGPALKGDHRSADICRKMLTENARLNALYADALPSLPSPTQTLHDDGSDEDAGPQDELSKLRASRFG